MSGPTDTDASLADLVALATRAVVEPVVVLAEIEQRRALAGRRLTMAEESMLHRAAAVAERALDHALVASRWARRAVTSARRAALGSREAEARLTLSLCLFEGGRTRAALAELARAEVLATGTTAIQVAGQRGIFLDRLGRFEESVAAHTATLSSAGEALDRMRALNNRAIAQAFLGRFAPARADLDDALTLADASGAAAIAARITHNIGFVHTLAGELPEALACFDRADAAFVELGLSLGQNHVARARALLLARQLDEARAALDDAVVDLEADGRWADAVDAMVLLARVTLAAGAVSEALDLATRAARAARRQQRPIQETSATAIVVGARLAQGRWSAALLRQVTDGADRLSEAGLVSEADELRLQAALIARRRHDRAGAALLLDRVRASRHRGTALDRSRAWYAEALHRQDAGDGRGLLDAARRGLAAVRQLQETAGATELRVSLAGHGESLARLGLEQLVARGDARAVLEWLRRWRGTALLRAPGSGAPVEWADDLSDDLAALRVARIRLDRAVESGDDPAMARRIVIDRERAVRGHAFRRRGPRSGSAPPLTGDVTDPRSVEPSIVYFECEEDVGAVVTVRGRSRMVHPLARLADVVHAVDHAHFGLRRLARPGGSETGRAAAVAATREALLRLDAALVVPLGLTRARASVRVSPPPSMITVPWSGLPSFADGAVTVAPSVGVGQRPVQRGDRVVLAAGPRLPGALAELDVLRGVHRRAQVFGPAASRVDDVLASMEGAAVAHLACHGRVRSDNPMLSELELADGPLTVYDIEKLRHPPAIVILAACDVGTATAGGGEELLGLVSALLAAGAGEVLASLVPVPDHAVVPFMVTLHRALAGGAALSQATAVARAGIDPAHGADLAIGAAFTCFG